MYFANSIKDEIWLKQKIEDLIEKYRFSLFKLELAKFEKKDVLTLEEAAQLDGLIERKVRDIQRLVEVVSRLKVKQFIKRQNPVD